MRKIFAFAIIAVMLIASIGVTAGLASSLNGKRVIILYKADVIDQDVGDLEEIGAKIKHRYNIIPAISADVDEEDIDDIESDEDVVAVFEDMRVHAFLSDSVPQINANYVHSDGVTGSGVKVCIVDTGVDDSHPALNPLIAEYDFVNGDANAADDNGHGTHVAGIVASTDSTYKGVAYGASLMAAKVLDAGGSGWASDVMAGIDWCVANGADIISMSLGGGAYTSTCDSEPIAQSSNNAVNQGVVVFAATGNDGYINAIAAPACASKVIAVGAVDKNDGRTPYSNEGTELDIVAPGTGTTSTYLGGGFATLTGTSMATPHASGTAALVLETNPVLTPVEVRTILQDTALDLGATGFDTIYGHGRVDAYAAYQYTLNPPPTPEQIFFDDFQSGSFDKWTESNDFDWNVENPAERNIPGYSSSNLVAHADNCDSFCVLTMTNSIDLSAYESATLKFWRYVDTGLDNGEYLKVEAFDGSSWNTIFYWTNGQGDDDIWHHETFDLPGYLVNNFNLRFISKESSPVEEVEIDDVLIEGAPMPVGNQLPVANAGPDQTLSDADGTGEESATLDGSSSYDPDGSIVSYEWEEGSTVLGTSAVINQSFVVGIHTVTLTVADNKGATGSDTAIITVNANQAPTANAGPDQVASDSDGDGFETVTLSGSGSDPDGIITAYEWKEGATVLGTSPTLTHSFSVGNHTLTFTVTDNGGATGSDTVAVTVNANQPPVANAGPDQTALVGQAVNFDGSASFDSDGSIVSYHWDFGDGSTSSGVTTSHVYSVAGTYTVTLTVTDNGGLTDSDTAVVTVNEKPSQPTIHVGDISFSYDKRSWRTTSYCKVTAYVPILDVAGEGVEEANVYGHWSNAYSADVNETTNVEGIAQFRTGWVRGCGTFTFTVDDVVKDDWIYDPTANVETSDSITL